MLVYGRYINLVVLNIPFWPNPVNTPDLIQKHFGYSQLWSLQSVCRQVQTRSYMPDLTSCVCFGFVLRKKAYIILCKTSPDLIWMAWSGFGQTHLVRKQAGLQESSDLVRADCNWPATSLPHLDMVAFFHRRRKTSLDLICSSWLYQVLAKQIRSRSKPVCKNHLAHVWLLSQSGLDTNCIWHVFGGR